MTAASASASASAAGGGGGSWLGLIDRSINQSINFFQSLKILENMCLFFRVFFVVASLCFGQVRMAGSLGER